VDESAEFGGRHRVRIDPEAVNGRVMGRLFFRVKMIGTHQERPSCDPDHGE
jgi:hypothetical protein